MHFKIHINPFTSKISMLILLTVCRTFHSFYSRLTNFQHFPGPVAFSRTFQSWKMPQYNEIPGLSRFFRTRTNPVLPTEENHAQPTGNGLLLRISKHFHAPENCPTYPPSIPTREKKENDSGPLIPACMLNAFVYTKYFFFRTDPVRSIQACIVARPDKMSST